LKILVVKTSSLGDVVHALPAVNALAEAFPDAEIDFLVCPAFADIVHYCRKLHQIILFDRKKFKNWKTALPYSLSLIRELRQREYDLIIDLQGLLRSALFAGFAKGKRKIGFLKPREMPARLFYNESAAVAPGHAVERNMALIRHITGIPATAELSLPEDPEFKKEAETLLKKTGVSPDVPLIAIAPGARWKSKRFPAELFGKAAKIIGTRHPEVRFLLLGASSENEDSATIAAFLPERAVNLTGKTSIGSMFELLRNARGLLCNDSGPMHIAAALHTPVLALNGPTAPHRTGPYGKNCRVLQTEELSCLGCLKRVCPKAATPPCWAIPPEQIADEVDAWF